MLKQKFCLWWIWYLLFDNAHFQRWLAWHRRRGWELAHVGGLFFHFTRGDGTDYRYYVQVMKDFPWTEQGRACIAGVEELGVKSGLPTAALLGVLMKLELAGRVSCLPGKRYILRGGSAS